MSGRVVRSITVRRPCDEVAPAVTDPRRVLEVIPGFARFSVVEDASAEADRDPGVDPSEPEDGEQWDVFLEVGTLHIGGRVLARRPSADRLEWESLRGTRHRFSLIAEPVGEDTRVTMALEYSLSGLLMARITETLGRGIVARHLEAGLEQLRHYLEYGETVGPA